MPKGSRPGERRGGRKAGAANLKTREIADAAFERGITPLEYMLEVLRDVGADTDRRDDMAKAAAPYMHPRLTAQTISGDQDKPIRVEILAPWLKPAIAARNKA